MPAPLDCPEMDCWRALLDDAVSPEERERCERHLESCPTCQERLDQADRCDGDWLGRARRVGDPTTTAAEPALADILERLHEGAAPPWADSPEPADLYFLEPSPRPDILGTLGDYEVLEVIGHGGMGIVLKALDPGLNRYVAIKVLAAAVAGSATGRRRFTREARAAAAVCHDHVVTVHGVHEEDGLPYLVMQYVAGESLQERIGRDGPLEVEEAVRIGMQTAAGLAAAHAQGLIHRDIKPANLLLEDGVARVKITDFGLARMADDAGLTRDGVVAGTPEYMAPEQARGEPVDHRADLYSLGAVLYACCTGQPPFRGNSAVAVLRRVSDEQPVPIRTRNPQAPAWLEALATRLMAKDPAERFQSAAEVAALLEGYLAHLRQPATVPAPPLPPPPGGAKAGAPRPRARSPRRAWLLALALLGAGLLGGPVLLLQAPPPPKPAAPVNFYQDFRGGQAPAPPLSVGGPDAQKFTRPEVGGFRVTLPKDRKSQDRVGLKMTTRIRGDFEITAGYEILQEEQPVQGHGVAFDLIVETDTPRKDVVELMRATGAERGEVYNCARISTDDQGQRTYHHEFPPASGDKGRLRLTRVGREVTLSAAEGANGEFQELTRYDLGVEDVIKVSATGFTGYAPNLLDLRILDFRVSNTPPAGGAAGAAGPSPAGPAKAHSRPWLTAVGFIGLLLLLTAFAVWLVASRRRRAEGEGRPAGEAPASAPVRIRWSRRSVGRAALALLAAVAAGAGVWLMGGATRTDTGPAQFHQDFRSLTEDNPVLRPIGLACQPDERGERIALAAGQGKLPHTGYQADLTVHGDFDITTSFEILQADQPDSGYGVGVSLYAATDPKTNDAVTLAWRLMPDGKAVFVANRLVPTGGKVESHVQTLPATATAGKLRLQRVGSVVRYLVADGADAPFVCMNEADMGTADVRPVQVGGDAGGSQAGLDARLLDFSVRAADLPELPEADRAATGAPHGRRGLAAGLIGLAVLLTALAVWLAGSRRAGGATGPAPEPTAFPRGALVRRLWPLLVLPGGLAAGLLALWLTGGAKAPAARPAGSPPAVAAAFQQDFRTTDLDDDVWKALDPAPERDGKGLRIKLETGPDHPHQMAIDTTFPVRGDFEITASYEVLAVDRPDRGYGAGVGLYVPIDPNTQDAVSLSRRLKPNGQVQFESDRMMPADGKVRFQVRTLPSTAPVGKLRLERVGTVLTFLVADGADAPFVVLDRVDLGTADMRFVRLEGNAGQSDAGLDARFLDFSVRAGELPGAPASGLVASTPPARFSWLTAAAVVGLLIVLAALGSWLVRRRRGRPRRAPVPDTVVKPAAAAAAAAAAPPVVFSCPGCGHGLKVKAELAGKKGKCPKCGHVLLVPAPVQAARPASPPA